MKTEGVHQLGWICKLHQLTKWQWKMTVDVKTCPIYWCAFCWSKSKFLWQIKHHEIRIKCLHHIKVSNLVQMTTEPFSLKTRIITGFFLEFCGASFKRRFPAHLQKWNLSHVSYSYMGIQIQLGILLTLPIPYSSYIQDFNKC